MLLFEGLFIKGLGALDEFYGKNGLASLLVYFKNGLF